MIVHVAVVIIAAIGVLSGHDWCGCSGRWRVVVAAVAGVRLLPTSLPDTALLLVVLLLLIRFLIVIVFLVVLVVKVATAATSQHLAIVVV